MISLTKVLIVEDDIAEDKPSYFYYYETEADYRSDSYYHFMADSELICPDVCFGRLEYDGIDEPKATESYLLEIFDPTLP